MDTPGRKTPQPSTPALLQLPRRVSVFEKAVFQSGFVGVLQAVLSRAVGPSPIASDGGTHVPDQDPAFSALLPPDPLIPANLPGESAPKRNRGTEVHLKELSQQEVNS